MSTATNYASLIHPATSGEISSVGQLGGQFELDDKDYSLANGVKTQLSNEKVLYMLVKNASGGTLAKGAALRWATTGNGPRQDVAAVAALGERACGIVSPWLSAAVPDGEFFPMIRRGPTKLAWDGASTIAALNPLQNKASGRFGTVLGRDGANLLYSNAASSAAIASTAVETDFDKTFSIPANSLLVGDVIKITAVVGSIGVTSTPTLNLKIYIGSVVLRATGTVTVAANDIGRIVIEARITAIGASGSVAAAGEQYLGVPGTAVPRPFITAGQTLDTTAAAIVKVSATWSASSSSNTATLTDLIVELLRPATSVGASRAYALEAKSSGSAGDLFRGYVDFTQD